MPLTTLEVRWFFEGPLDEAVQHWFAAGPGVDGSLSYPA